MAAPTAVGSVPTQTTVIGVSVNLDASGYFSDIDAGNSLFFGISGLPTGTGLSISSTTGVISGTPTSADLAASFNATVTATDEDNHTRQVTVSFIVAAVPTAAQNYYIDGTNGSDTYTGLSATFTSGTTGPWKTISRANAVAPHASGNVDIWVTPGNYRNQPIAPTVSGTDDTHRKRYRVNGSGVVYILGPSSGSILYGLSFGTPATETVAATSVNYISVLRESSSSYFCLDGEVAFGTDPGEVAKNGAPESVAHITRGAFVNGVGIELDMDMKRTAGWDGLRLEESCDLIELAINYDQHGTSYHSSGDDFGDMFWVAQPLAVGS
jgi:hypothetical protein